MREPTTAVSTKSSLVASAAAALANACFGAGAVAIRWALRETDATALAFLRYAIAAACFLPFFVFGRDRTRFSREDLPRALGLGLVLYGVLPVVTNVALEETTAWRATLIMAATPTVTLVFARLAGREHPSGRKMLGVFLALAGVALAIVPSVVTGKNNPDAWKGDALMVVVTLGLASYNVLSGRMVRRYSPLALAGYGMVASLGLLFPAMLVQGPLLRPLRYTATTWGVILFLGVVGTALGFFLMTWALARTTPVRVAITINFMPVTAAVLGSLLLSEHLTVWWGVGALVVLGGVLLTSFAPVRTG